MHGLLLSSYYLVRRSLFMYITVAILVAGFMLGFGDESMYPFVVILTLIFVAIPALEVIKHEGKSGFDKYVLTLPLARRHVVQTHFLFYFFVLTLGTILSIIIFYVYRTISTSEIDSVFIFNIIGPGVGLILMIGAITYPLLYIFGSEKSDGILIIAAIGSVFATIGLERLFRYVFNEFPLFGNLFTVETYIPVGFIIFGIVIYFIAFIIATIIYNRREF